MIRIDASSGFQDRESMNGLGWDLVELARGRCMHRGWMWLVALRDAVTILLPEERKALTFKKISVSGLRRRRWGTRMLESARRTRTLDSLRPQQHLGPAWWRLGTASRAYLQLWSLVT